MQEGASITTRRASVELPFRTGITTSEKIDSIKGLINQYSKSTPSDFNEKCKSLEEIFKAYQALGAISVASPLYLDSRNCLGTITCLYARAHYPQFEACKNLYLYALSIYISSLEKCCTVELPFDQFESLAELKAKLNTHPSALENFVLGSGREFIVRRSFNEEDARFLAHHYRFLGHCYQNIDSYVKAGDEKILSLFESIYSVAEILLKDAKEASEGYEELTELYYNSWPFMYWLKNPEDPIGKMAIYDSHVLSRDSSDPMMARVLNMKSIISGSDLEDLDQAIHYAEESFKIRERIENNNPFLLANLKNNLAKLYLKAYPDKLSMPEKYLQEAVDYAIGEIEKNNIHPYYALYFQGLALIRDQQKNTQKAVELMNLAVKILENYSSSYGPTLEVYKMMLEALLKKL